MGVDALRKDRPASVSGFDFFPQHLEVLAQSVAANLDPEDVGSARTLAFAETLPNVQLDALPEGAITRSHIFGLATTPEINTVTVCAAIMAWGGMHRGNRDRLFKGENQTWLNVSERIRQGELGRKAAYDAFRDLQGAGELKGMGPAYYTKLIYFLMPRGPEMPKGGYIMDQWVGCSVNLLTGRQVVLMDTNHWWTETKGKLLKKSDFTVSNVNTGENYLEFCRVLDALAERFDIEPDQMDRALMSDGGRKPALWRRHVTEHRTQ